MIKKILKNGLTIILDKRKSNSVVIEATIKVGSNNEDSSILGITHFIEHLMFNGTKTRTSKQIASEIECTGGEINAITTNERTSYYVKIPSKYSDVAIDVISDCITNSKFEEAEIEKERNIILSEIDIYNDTPTAYQWILFQSKLFKIINAKYPIYGNKECIKKIKRNEILDYYNKYYTKRNLIVTITGNYDKDVIKKVETKFKSFRGNATKKINQIFEPEQSKIEEFIERKNLDHSYIIIGYKVANRVNKDSYVLDIIKVILGIGASSRLFGEIRLKRGLGYSVGAHYDGNREYGFFVAYLTTNKKNIEDCKKIVLNEYEKIKNVSDKELENAKRFIEGQFLLENEDNFKRADLLSFWEVIMDSKLAKSYIKEIKKVTKDDVKRVVSKYFHKNYCCVIITK